MLETPVFFTADDRDIQLLAPDSSLVPGRVIFQDTLGRWASESVNICENVALLVDFSHISVHISRVVSVPEENRPEEVLNRFSGRILL